MPSVTVRNYQDSPTARTKLFAFYQTAYPGNREVQDGDRFEWQSFQNPLAPPDTNYLYHLFAEDDRIIGQNILLPYQLSIGAAVRDALCSTNLIVMPGLEGKGLGHRLIEQHEQLGKVCFAVGITEASSRAFQKRGWSPVNDSRLFVKVLRPVPLLRYLGKSSGFWRLASRIAIPFVKLANLLFALRTTLSVPRHIPGVTCEEISQFEPAWDALWPEYLKAFAIHFVRRADFLNWKYCSRHDVQHRVLIFKKDQRPVAYVVYRPSRNTERGIYLGRITDFVHDPSVHPKFLHYIVATAIRALQKDSVDGIVGIASSPEIAAAFRANGMILSRPQPAIIREEGFTLSQLRDQYPHLWYITLGDSDLDNYW